MLPKIKDRLKRYHHLYPHPYAIFLVIILLFSDFYYICIKIDKYERYCQDDRCEGDGDAF